MMTRTSGVFKAGDGLGCKGTECLDFSVNLVQLGFLPNLAVRMNHYDTLGISQSASSHEIKNAYRGLVKIYHPDLSKAPDAHERMLAINEAYEVLSDSYSRNLYDLLLSGQAFSMEPPQETEAQRYRREYKQRRVHDERVQMENLIKLKVRFYRVERMAAYVFLALGILFTIDYFFHPFQKAFGIQAMESSRFQTEINMTNGSKMLADWDLLKEYQVNGGTEVRVSYSLVFGIPARIGLVNSDINYRVHRTLHSFRNVITLIILIFSLVVINNKEYTDFRLTCGLVPVLLIIFQLLMAANTGFS
jgi:hypothetical protein